MKTMKKENEMNEASQIRERFLAETRQHFFAADAARGSLQSATCQSHTPCHGSKQEQRSGNTLA